MSFGNWWTSGRTLQTDSISFTCSTGHSTYTVADIGSHPMWSVRILQVFCGNPLPSITKASYHTVYGAVEFSRRVRIRRPSSWQRVAIDVPHLKWWGGGLGGPPMVHPEAKGPGDLLTSF